MDVDHVLDSIGPRVFDEWVAFRQVVPDPDERLREIVKRGFTALVRAWGGDLELSEIDPWHDEDHAGGFVSPAQAAAIMRAKAGPNR